MFLKKILPIILLCLFFGFTLYFLNNTQYSKNDTENIQKVEEMSGDFEDTNSVEGQDDVKDYLAVIDLEHSPSMGEKDAPVIMVNYSSYYCPFCSRFKKEIFPDIKEKYIDTGKVLYFYKDAGSPDDNVFLAAHCATTEERFWEYQDALVKDGVQSEEDLYTYAEALGLDIERFSECLDEGCCDHILKQSQKEMSELNITGVPFFVINNTAVSGLSSAEEFFRIIDEELDKVDN